MAGTRLWTQAAFVLGVVFLFIPPAIYVHHVHRASFPISLPFPPNITTATPTILPISTLHISIHQVVVPSKPGPILDWENIMGTVSANDFVGALGGHVILSRGEDLELPFELQPMRYDADGAATLQQWFDGLSITPPSAMTYALLLLPPDEHQVRIHAPYFPLCAPGSRHEEAHLSMSIMHPQDGPTIAGPELTLGGSIRLAWLRGKGQSESSVVAAIKVMADYLFLPLMVPPPELDYHLRFTLLNERPDVHYCHWDFSEIQRMLAPEIERLNVVTDLWVTADMIAHMSLIEDHEIARKKAQPARAYVPLSSMVGFPSRVNLHPPFTSRSNASRHHEMVVVCPPPTKAYHAFLDDINDNKGSGDSDVTCAIDGWGAVTILKMNGRSSPCELIGTDYERIMGAAFGVFRSYLGFARTPEQSTKEGFPGEVVVLPSSGPHSVTTWELDRAIIHTMRSRAQKAVQLLYALTSLLQRRPSIPFQDDVASRGLQAISVLEGLHGVTDLTSACQEATRALRLAHDAYFDPSLLPSSILPWEHFLAIYLPLVAPLLVPLVGGLFKEVKRYKEKTASKRHQA